MESERATHRLDEARVDDAALRCCDAMSEVAILLAVAAMVAIVEQLPHLEVNGQEELEMSNANASLQIAREKTVVETELDGGDEKILQ